MSDDDGWTNPVSSDPDPDEEKARAVAEIVLMASEPLVRALVRKAIKTKDVLTDVIWRRISGD